MTYTKAATCGENFKARVTPEQNEKMQRAWFAAGKTWIGGCVKVEALDRTFLFLRKDLSITTCEAYFTDSFDEEIELIDDLPQHDFASQQEVTLWVAQGNKAKHMENESVVGFKDGVLWDFAENRKCHWQFLDFDLWQKHTPPRLIRVNGVEVPAPLESLDGLDVVFVPDFFKGGFKKFEIKDMSDVLLKTVIDLKIGYATKEDAIARAEAMQIFEVVE